MTHAQIWEIHNRCDRWWCWSFGGSMSLRVQLAIVVRVIYVRQFYEFEIVIEAAKAGDCHVSFRVNHILHSRKIKNLICHIVGCCCAGKCFVFKIDIHYSDDRRGVSFTKHISSSRFFVRFFSSFICHVSRARRQQFITPNKSLRNGIKAIWHAFRYYSSVHTHSLVSFVALLRLSLHFRYKRIQLQWILPFQNALNSFSSAHLPALDYVSRTERKVPPFSSLFLFALALMPRRTRSRWQRERTTTEFSQFQCFNGWGDTK